MADFNAIGNPFLGAGVARVYGVDKPVVSVVGSEIQPTTSPWERPEFWALLGGSLGIGVGIAAPDAAFPSQVMLFNPLGSGCMLLLEKIVITNINNLVGFMSVALQNSSTGWTSTGAWVNRDYRRATTVGGAGSLAGRIFIRSNAAVGINSLLAQILVPGINSFVLDADFVIPPGWGINVFAGPPGTAVANQQMVATFIGRERPAPGPELGNL